VIAEEGVVAGSAVEYIVTTGLGDNSFERVVVADYQAIVAGAAGDNVAPGLALERVRI
jgi:hypothetical protein